VILGLDTTVPVALNAVIHYTRAAARNLQRELVAADAVLELSGHNCPGDAECSTTVSGGRNVCSEGRTKA
jgi:ketopantoate hydroxymethyltransferase